MSPPPRTAAIRLRLRKTVLAQRPNTRRPIGKQRHRQPWPAKMWVSTNKVLIGSVGGLKKAHCRNPNFDCEETKLLISLWGDPQVQRTLITTHKKHPVIAKLAEKMREYGYNRSTEEINTRIKNLKCFYNRIKKDLETGVINEPSWKHFHSMDEILTRPVFGGANAASRYRPTPCASGGTTPGPSGSGHPSRLSAGSGTSGPADLPPDLDPDQIEVKLELVSDDEKELRPEDLLKNAEQVELKEPNLLIPKDEPMEEEEDDPNDPDFEDDGGSETDDESSGMDEADESDRSTRLRRRIRRAHKSKKSNVSTPGGKSTSTTGTPVPGSIKIINYTAGTNFNVSSVANVVSVASSAASTLAGRKTDATATTTTTTAPSKISLVPTNFLLKPQASTIGFKQPIQLYTKPTVSIASTIPPSSGVPISAGPGTAPAGTATAAPMKVFLVNTLSKDGSAPKQQLISAAGATKPLYTTTTGVSLQGTSHVSGLPQISIQPKQLLTATGATTLGRKIIHPTAATTVRPVGRAADPPTPKLGGFKSLLNQLVGLQRENLGITKTHLVTERERFGNEKSVAKSLLEALGELNGLLAEINGELPDVKHSDGEGEHESTVKNNSCAASSVRRTISRHDDEDMKAEVISDSE